MHRVFPPQNYNLYPKKCNPYHNTYYFILICYTEIN